MFHPNGEIESSTTHATTIPFADVFALPPPRQLPPEVERHCRRVRGLATVVAAAVFLLIGGIFFAVGLPLTLVFFPWHIQDSLALSSGNSATAPGLISSVDSTGYSINRTGVHRLHYTFALDGREWQGQCYFAGGSYSPGGPVSVQYLANRPEINCASGGTFDPIGNYMALMAIMPLTGLVFLCLGAGFGVWSLTVGRRRNLNLARDGLVAEGRVREVVGTSVRINQQKRYKVYVIFNALGPSETSYNAYGPDVDQARRWQESGAALHVLYDRERPERALVLEHFLG